MRLQPHAQISIKHTWYQTIRANMFKLEIMKLLGSHLLLMLPKPHPTLQTSHNLQIYISMTRSLSALLCSVFHVGTLPLMVPAHYILCQSPLMEKVQSHSETCYCRPLCLRKARYDWCRYHRPSAMCSYPTARE